MAADDTAITYTKSLGSFDKLKIAHTQKFGADNRCQAGPGEEKQDNQQSPETRCENAGGNNQYEQLRQSFPDFNDPCIMMSVFPPKYP